MVLSSIDVITGLESVWACEECHVLVIADSNGRK